MTQNSGKNSVKRRGRTENLTPWKPGTSGNPGGRPKKKPLTEAYERILSDPASADAIAKAMIRLARKGNVQATREIADRVEGKVNSTESEQRDAPTVLKYTRDPVTPAVRVPEHPELDDPGVVQ